MKISPIFSLIFLSIFGLFNLIAKNRKLNLGWIDLMLLVLSVNRMGRLFAYDKAMETYRAPFVKTTKDDSGAGETTKPKNTSELVREIGTLISCPICIGTWISAGLVYGMVLFPRVTRVFTAILGFIGAAEILNALTEHLDWSAQSSRYFVGLLDKSTKE